MLKFGKNPKPEDINKLETGKSEITMIQPGSSAIKPYSPNEISAPRSAFPFIRPRCCFRYFTRFGINISKLSFDPRQPPQKRRQTAKQSVIR